MDRKKRLTIIDWIHESFAWITSVSFGCMMFLTCIQLTTMSQSILIRTVVAVAILFSDMLLWKSFAKEYAIYYWLNRGEPIEWNLIPVKNIGHRYEDYLSKDCKNRRLPVTSVAMFAYVGLQAFSKNISVSAAVWLARIVTIIAVTMIVGLILTILTLRFRRRYEGEIELRTE